MRLRTRTRVTWWTLAWLSVVSVLKRRIQRPSDGRVMNASPLCRKCRFPKLILWTFSSSNDREAMSKARDLTSKTSHVSLVPESFDMEPSSSH